MREIGLKDPRDNSKLDTANVVSDIQLPTTKQLSVISARDYQQEFDGKYTRIPATPMWWCPPAPTWPMWPGC